MHPRKECAIGAYLNLEGVTTFTVWAPNQDSVKIKFLNSNSIFSMEKKEKGYFQYQSSKIKKGDTYVYVLDDKEWSDPASFYQPKGVHGPSEVIDHNEFEWKYLNNKLPRFDEWIVYELHLGTFSEEGSFNGVLEKIPHLKDFGINAIEIMPIAQFPGKRNWGYDGVYPFAVHNEYGDINQFKCLIDHCHKEGIAVVLDVVYNHLGPEGNYFWQYGPYFTDKYKTPWGPAINFDDSHSDEVRHYFIQNVLYWAKYFNLDGLRLDAVHAIWDRSAINILEEMKLSLEKEGLHSFKLIAESDLNDPRIIEKRELGGYGLDAQWADDLHHALHVYLTKEKRHYYLDYGEKDCIKKALLEGFVYTGQFSTFRQKSYGRQLNKSEKQKLIVSLQNHDQIGNRPLGDRLSNLVSIDKFKWAYGLILLSPYIPMIFMGDETYQKCPFNYFVDHGDEDLIKAVEEGRKKEFEGMFQENDDYPIPQDEQTFESSKISWEISNEMFSDFFKGLVSLRKKKIDDVVSFERQEIIDHNFYWVWKRYNKKNEFITILSFEKNISFRFPENNRYTKIFDTDEKSHSERITHVGTHIDYDQKVDLFPFQIICLQRS